MTSKENRATHLEEQVRPVERMFIGWAENPWMPEQKAEAIRLNPEQRVFWRSLRDTPARGAHGPPLSGELTRPFDDGSHDEKTTAVTLDYLPHAAQMEIHKARDKRFRVICAGRRFGKTLGLAAELLDRGGCTQGGDYGWVAPTYNVAERGIEAFRRIGYGVVQVCGRAPCRVEFQGRDGLARTRIWFLSADNPDNIRGYGFQGLVIDEAAAIPPDVWHYVLRPTIAQTLGWAVLVSTPKGRNWFYDLFSRGLAPDEKEYASFTFGSRASPFFPASEWDEAKRTLGETVFRQEFLAEFLEDSAGVFRGIEGCLIADCKLKIEDLPRRVVIGCDVAKHTDFTVLIAMDADTGRCFAMERFNHLDWTIQKERIVAFSRRWRGRLILDATGVGDPIYDDLKRVLPEVEAIQFTTQNKVHLIQRLAHAVGERKVTWPGTAGDRSQYSGVSIQNGESERSTSNAQRPTFNLDGNWDVLTTEMKRFEYDIREGGGITYGAPAGYHDDCVIALALANHGRWEVATTYVGSMHRIEGRNRTPSDGGYESEGGLPRWRFARRSRCVMG